MAGTLHGYYPYIPTLQPNGSIDPSSIHTQRTEFLLSTAITAPVTAVLVKTTSYKWALLGTAAFGSISYIFWHFLGKKVTNEIADQACIPIFLHTDTISSSVCQRIANNNILQKKIFDQICRPGENNDALLGQYFAYLASCMESFSRLDLYFKIIEKMQVKQIKSFIPTPQQGFEMWKSWTCHAADETEPSLDKAKLLLLNFPSLDCSYKGKTPLSYFAKMSAARQDDASVSGYQHSMLKMNSLLKVEPNLTFTLEPADYIKPNSPLGMYLNSIQEEQKTTNPAALLLKKYIIRKVRD